MEFLQRAKGQVLADKGTTMDADGAALGASQMLHVLLISPSMLEREALTLILERDGFAVRSSGMEIEALTLVPAPELILVDVPGEPDVARVSWLEELRCIFPSAPLVLLSHRLNPEWLVLCRGAKIDGYLSKASPAPAFCRQLRLIAGGERIVPVSMLREIVSIPAQQDSKADLRRQALTKRDLEVLNLLVAGHSNKVIADRLQIAESTVKVAMKSVFAKICVTNRTQAAVWALNNGVDKAPPASEIIRNAS